jgi:hypothetical protein
MSNDNYVALTKCFYCGGPGDILLATRLGVDVKTLYHNKVVNGNPCNHCAEHMKIGVILISMRDGEADKCKENSKLAPENRYSPFRTGRLCVIKNDAAERLFPPEHQALRLKWCFVEDGAWKELGLPIKPTDYSDPRELTDSNTWARCKACETWRRVQSTWGDGSQENHAEISARCLVCNPDEDDRNFTTVPHILELYTGPKGTDKVYEEQNKKPDSAPSTDAPHC